MNLRIILGIMIGALFLENRLCAQDTPENEKTLCSSPSIAKQEVAATSQPREELHTALLRK